MAKTIEKYKAINLRQKGKSINEIARELNSAKSSVSFWCRDILLGQKQIARLAKRQKSGSYKGRMKFLERVRRERQKETAFLRKQGIKEVGKISRRDLFISGIAMYWSEGYTYSSGEQVGFTNSDPNMVLLMLRWFKEICQVPEDKFSFQIKINRFHENRIGDVENYWSGLIKVPLSHFNKTILIKSRAKKVYPNPEFHFGTLRVTIRKGTKLRRKINGWIEGLVKET